MWIKWQFEIEHLCWIYRHHFLFHNFLEFISVQKLFFRSCVQCLHFAMISQWLLMKLRPLICWRRLLECAESYIKVTTVIQLRLCVMLQWAVLTLYAMPSFIFCKIDINLFSACWFSRWFHIHVYTFCTNEIMVTLEIFDTALYECHISYVSYRRYLKNQSQEVSKYFAFIAILYKFSLIFSSYIFIIIIKANKNLLSPDTYKLSIETKSARRAHVALSR